MVGTGACSSQIEIHAHVKKNTQELHTPIDFISRNKGENNFTELSLLWLLLFELSN